MGRALHTVNLAKLNFKHMIEKKFPTIKILHLTVVLWHQMFDLENEKAAVSGLETVDCDWQLVGASEGGGGGPHQGC
jgi:hypothetical protein